MMCAQSELLAVEQHLDYDALHTASSFREMGWMPYQSDTAADACSLFVCFIFIEPGRGRR